MCLKMNFLEGLPRWFTWASIGLLDQCCEKGRAFQKSVKMLSIVGDLNCLNGCWRAQHVSNHHRCFHVVANSAHQVANVLGCVTGFSFLWGYFRTFRISQYGRRTLWKTDNTE